MKDIENNKLEKGLKKTILTIFNNENVVQVNYNIDDNIVKYKIIMQDSKIHYFTLDIFKLINYTKKLETDIKNLMKGVNNYDKNKRITKSKRTYNKAISKDSACKREYNTSVRDKYKRY